MTHDFQVGLKVNSRKGSVTAADTTLLIRGAGEVTLFYTAATDYDPETLGLNRSVDPETVCRKIIQQVNNKSFGEILSDHIKDHASLFDRVTL